MTFDWGVSEMDFYTKVKFHAVQLVGTVLFLAVLGGGAWFELHNLYKLFR